MQNLPLLEHGKFFHIYNRGNNGENIFIEERNYHYFLLLYEKYILPVADTFAFCLLMNHFHLFVRIKSEGEIIKGMDLQGLDDVEGLKIPDPTNQFSIFFNAYAKAINKAYGRTGSLFEKRSSDVWQLLGAVKTEFGNFGDILDKTKKKLQETSNTIESATKKNLELFRGN